MNYVDTQAAFTVNQTNSHLHIAFNPARWVLSSAVLNGGWGRADHIINVKVAQNFHGEQTEFDPPETSLRNTGRALGLSGRVVGMMTAASMDSFRQVTLKARHATVTALVTAGISNAKRAGEPAEWQQIDDTTPKAGTINIVAITNLQMSRAAMVEAIMMVTEAKTVAMANLGVASPQTGLPATGTGTDAVAIAAGFNLPRVRYCGKHVLFGQMLAQATIQAITTSLDGKV